MAATALAVACVCQSALAQPVSIPGNHPAQAETQAPVSAADPGQVLELEVRFALRNPAALDRLLMEQQDPHSARFHQWLSSAEFNHEFGPRQSDVDAVAKWLERSGFTIHSARAADGFLSASATVAQAEQAFSVRIAKFADGPVYANTADPVLPAEFAGLVSAIVGLDNMYAAVPASHRPDVLIHSPLDAPGKAGAARVELASAQDAAAAPAGGFSIKPDFDHNGEVRFGPQDIRTFYNEDSLLGSADGSGGCIAIIGLSNFPDGAVALFNNTFGLPASNITRKIVDSDPGINGDESEALLDIEWSHAVAPGARTNYYFGSLSHGFIKAISAAVNENACSVISISFGMCSDTKTMFTGTLDPLFKKAAAQGQSVFVSSGDQGAAGQVYSSAAHGCVDGTSRNVNEMSADPNATSVGGTAFNPNFDGNGDDVGFVAERAWNDAEEGVTMGEATGGGVSAVFAKPSYQVGTPSDGKRDVPDIAMLGSPAFPGVFLGDDTVVGLQLDCCWGGTSLSAPLWAGFARVVSQFSGFRLGNVNYAIYKLGNQGQAANGLRDVVTGNNDFDNVTGFTATAKYDQVSGWGTPDMTVLASAIKSVGPPPSGAMKLTPPKTNFGRVKVVPNAASKVRKFKLAYMPKNSGPGGVASIDIVPIAPTPAGQFQIDPSTTTCAKNSPLPCTIGVKFTPTGAGAMSATLVVTDGAKNSPQKATLMGTAK